jgi:sorting nexin-25
MQQKSASSITVHSTSKQFDEFMRSIPKLKTLGDARRLRSDVERESRSARAGLDKARNNSNNQSTQDAARKLVRYVDRLERARTYIDRRIATLSGGLVSFTSSDYLTDPL